MDLAAVFLLSLVGGYYFSVLWRLTAFSTRRVDGHHLYFRAALCGAIFFAIALALRNLVLVWIPGYPQLDAALIDYVKPALKEEPGSTVPEQARRAEWVITAVYSLLVGPLSAAILNVFSSREKALERSFGALNRVLFQAQQQDMPVQVTLNSGKVYIGLANSIPDADPEPDVIKILPMFSGYRDARGRMVLTTDYRPVYTALDAGQAAQLNLPDPWLDQFELTIRADSIVTATLFSPAVYANFNPDWEQEIAQQDQKPPPQELTVRIKQPL